MYRIALVLSSPEAEMVGPIPRGQNPRAFVEGLRDLGWVSVAEWCPRGDSNTRHAV